MPRKREVGSAPVVCRSARIGVRASRAQARRLWALLVAGGDVWACVLALNALRRQRGDAPLVSYQGLCRELATSGPGTFGELDSVGARSVLRRYSDAWFAAARARRACNSLARFPRRRRRRMMPLHWYAGTFTLSGRRLRLPVAKGAPPLWVRLDREPPYPPGQIRSVTLCVDAGRLVIDVCAEVPVASYASGTGPDPNRVAGVDLGIIHPYAVAGPDGAGLHVSGRALRAESRLHLAERKARSRAVAARAPARGQRGSRRWRQFRARTRRLEARHRRRLAQARHEAARAVVDWALDQRVGTLVVGDPAGVLAHDSGPPQPARARLAAGAAQRRARRQGRGPRHRRGDRRRALHLFHVPGLCRWRGQAPRAALLLPALRPGRPPRSRRGDQHRRQAPRRRRAGLDSRDPGSPGQTHIARRA